MKTEQDLIRISPQIYSRQIAALTQLKERTGTPISWHIREAIDQYLKRQKR